MALSLCLTAVKPEYQLAAHFVFKVITQQITFILIIVSYVLLSKHACMFGLLWSI